MICKLLYMLYVSYTTIIQYYIYNLICDWVTFYSCDQFNILNTINNIHVYKKLKIYNKPTNNIYIYKNK